MNTFWIILGGIIGIFGLVGIIVCFASVHKLEDYEVALNYNPSTVKIDKT